MGERSTHKRSVATPCARELERIRIFTILQLDSDGAPGRSLRTSRGADRVSHLTTLYRGEGNKCSQGVLTDNMI
jgi:hypothetical protein